MNLLSQINLLALSQNSINQEFRLPPAEIFLATYTVIGTTLILIVCTLLSFILKNRLIKK